MNRDCCGALDQLLPMHAVLDDQGAILHIGPTLAKVFGDTSVVGQSVFDVMAFSRPKGISGAADLPKVLGRKLRLETKGAVQTRLTGVLAQGDDKIYILDTSFGFSVAQSVTEHRLVSTDFSPTDLTVEMLFVIEAKSAAMSASRQLNQRLQAARIAAEEQAFTDTLTGLKNRRALDVVLERMRDQEFALIYLDLDYFKAVNDTHGHAAGDAVLQAVAKILVSNVRRNDTVARIGGDEFVIVCPGMIRQDALGRLARKMIDEIEVPIPFGDISAKISSSIGIVSHKGGEVSSMESLSEMADAALYAAKNAGRGQAVFAT